MENRWLWRSGGALLFIYSYLANLKTSGPRRNRIFWSDGLAPGCWSLHAYIQSSSWERRSCHASVASNFHCIVCPYDCAWSTNSLFPLFLQQESVEKNNRMFLNCLPPEVVTKAGITIEETTPPPPPPPSSSPSSLSGRTQSDWELLRV